MNYLLDTHAFIWAISEKESLSSAVRKILNDSGNTIFVSSITFWEISLKFSVGKLNIQGILPGELPKLSIQTGFQLLPLSHDESATYHNLTLTNHKDPFDRMLVWQAIQRDLIFVSKDRYMEQYGAIGLKTLW